MSSHSELSNRGLTLTPSEVTRDERRRAVLAVVQRSTSVPDCLMLLDMLGLNPREGL